MPFNKETGICSCGYISDHSGLACCPKCGLLPDQRQDEFKIETTELPNDQLVENESTIIGQMNMRRVFAPKHPASYHEQVLPPDEPSQQTFKEILEEGLTSLSPSKGYSRQSQERPTFEQVYMELAKILSMRSTCSRRHVGCAIVTRDYKRVLSVGYNGNAAGLPNRCDEPEATGKCGCLHAEENAVISCSESPTTQKIVFTTVYPCKMCAKRIVQLGGVIRVYYLDDYRNNDAIDVFEKSGIMVTQIKVELGESDV